MELKEGMYVRTNEGVRQIIDIYENTYELNKCLHYNYSEGHDLYEEDIDEIVIKASYKIIDLIEYGDFITLGENNYPLQVRNVWEHAGDIHIELSNGAKFEDLHNNKDFKIYSIVTKEQFESMSYKVGDE